MTDRLKYDPLKRLFKEFSELVNTPNALKHAERKKEIYRKIKKKKRYINSRAFNIYDIGKRNSNWL
jgi:hypothetical protein